MDEIKRLKDPLYGYITIATDVARKIVDTPTFQRLRRVMQTSYSPLYSSSIHNRFIHSLGVFHLGSLASSTIVNQINSKKINIINIDVIQKTFLLACLLHDVGHAPFSHTGEKFYLDDIDSNKYRFVHERLKGIVNSASFTDDVPVGDSNSAAPHEVMSVIENVVFAHDAERKWIQNHPTVLYEIYIIQHIINELNTKFSTHEKKLFSEGTLSREGIIFEDDVKVSLMCDDDLIFLLKSKLSDPLSKEYFDRNSRRNPIWKSESEYKSYLKNSVGDKVLLKIENALK